MNDIPQRSSYSNTCRDRSGTFAQRSLDIPSLSPIAHPPPTATILRARGGHSYSQKNHHKHDDENAPWNPICSRIFRFTHCIHFSAALSPISGLGSTNPSCKVSFRVGRGTGHGRSSTAITSASSEPSTSPPSVTVGTSAPSASSAPAPALLLLLLLAADVAAPSATNLACVRRIRRCVVIFAFIIASSERGRG